MPHHDEGMWEARVCLTAARSGKARESVAGSRAHETAISSLHTSVFSLGTLAKELNITPIAVELEARKTCSQLHTATAGSSDLARGGLAGARLARPKNVLATLLLLQGHVFQLMQEPHHGYRRCT